MSTKPDILALATTFAGVAVDPVLLERDFDDVCLHLDATEFLVAWTLVEHDRDNPTYRVPPTALRLLAVFYDDRQLGMADATALEAVTPRWRDAVGSPVAFVTETEGDRMVRLYPSPDAASKPFSFDHGLPFGVDFPAYAIGLVATEAGPRETGNPLPDWLDLPVALALLARHFTREERYRDPLFATTVRRMADRLLEMVA